MINIVNHKTYRGEGVYIGRPSPLGNPFRIGEHGTREEVIAKYRGWLWRQIQQQNDVYRELLRLVELARTGDLTLICWCKQPNQESRCHGDILKAAVTWMMEINSSFNHPA
ncbi:MAG: DUF4326 domain-containing protein [Acidobacteria bacterium]|nr:DUF4326 domain-containing protein [Acidobacteriota bacterium]